MSPTQKAQAVQTVQHDEDLAKLEADTEAALEKEQQGSETGAEPAKSSEPAEKESSAPASAPGETTPSSSPSQPETPPAAPPTEPAKGEPEADDLDAEELQQLSPKAQKRYRKLAQENRRLRGENARAMDVRKRFPHLFGEPAAQTPVEAGGLPWEPGADQDQGVREVTPEQYAADVEGRAEAIVERQLFIRETTGQIDSDVSAIEKEFPELNADSPEHDPDLDDFVYRSYIARFKDDMDQGKAPIRFGEFVQSFMGHIRKSREKGKTQVTTAVMKQAAEQAVAPSALKPEVKSPEDAIQRVQSIEELEALEHTLR